jgi:mannosyl-oligosaccharide glucosidase
MIFTFLILPFLARLSFANSTDTLLWGAYRPGLYFGLRPRLPQSLLTGLVWFGTQDFGSVTSEHAHSLFIPS